MQLLVYPVTVFFSWYARDAGFSHMYTELKTAFIMQCEETLSEVGRGEVVSYIIGSYFNTYYWTLFSFFFFFF